MTQLDLLTSPYNGLPGYRRPGTSEEAARAIAPKAAILRRRVLDAYTRLGAMTPDECASALGEPFPHSVRSRCSELRADGYLIATGERRPNAISGLMADVLAIAARPEKVAA